MATSSARPVMLSFPSSIFRQTSRLRSSSRTFPVAFERLYRRYGTKADGAPSNGQSADPEPAQDLSYLNPDPDDYSRFIFQDKCRSTLYTGSGGNGCVSFLREKYIEEGPPNGGDGGSGGSVYIQAIENMTSLHKLARSGVIRAERGKNGRGKSKGGRRGEDVLIQVPVGTVVREISRYDPVAVEEQHRKMAKNREKDEETEEMNEMGLPSIRHDRWVLYPGANPSDFLTTQFPDNPPRRPQIAALEPKVPIHLDLSRPMDKPILLAAGAVGGWGNHYFATGALSKPTFAAKGEGGTRLDLEFELKLLADVGLVGKPNAGKSTLLRSLTNSRTRIGDWEFTTLSPSIGTVVIDDYKGRPMIETTFKSKRTNFTIADIPGLIEDAHLDRGLGLGFLRHIERARILAFVIDLSAEDPVQSLKNLWHELHEYQQVREAELVSEKDNLDLSSSGLPELDEERQGLQEPSSLDGPVNVTFGSENSLPSLKLPPVHTKPWFVVATKADLPETQERFKALQEYVSAVEKGEAEHPSGYQDGWNGKLEAIPVSAMRAEGVKRIPKLVMKFLD